MPRTMQPMESSHSTLEPNSSLQPSQEPPNSYRLSLGLLSSPGPRLVLPRLSRPQPDANEFSKIIIYFEQVLPFTSGGHFDNSIR